MGLSQVMLAKSQDLRHTCEQDEGMAGYGWTTYDTRKGGVHVVNDTGNKVDLVTYFTKLSDDASDVSWGLRVKVFPRNDAIARQNTTIVFYLGGTSAEAPLIPIPKNNPSSHDLLSIHALE